MKQSMQGGAAVDDARNQDNIGENEILAASSGTSLYESRAADIKAVEDALQEAFPDWSVRRAFTSHAVLRLIRAGGGENIDNVEQALARAAANGVKNLIIQPTHLVQGAEYHRLITAVSAYQHRFETLKIAEPLLGEAGTDAAKANAAMQTAAEIILTEAAAEAGYRSIAEAKNAGTAFAFIGHGTSHGAAASYSYSQMQEQMNALGYDNAFIGTLKGVDAFSCSAVIAAAAKAGCRRAVIRPLMIAAGAHACRDIAGGHKSSWAGMFQASGQFESVQVQAAGLGRIRAVQQIYAAHTKAALPLSP